MKFSRFTFFAIFLAITISGFAAYRVISASDKIVAKVNGEPVFEKEIIDRYNDLTRSTGKDSFNSLSKEAKQSFTKDVLLFKLLDEAALKANIEQDPDYQKMLKFVLAEIRQKVFVEKTIYNQISDKDLKQEYEQYLERESSKFEYKAAHILLDSQEAADKIYDEISKGLAFSDAAKKYSKDSNKESGGELGTFSSGDMVPEFDNALQAMQAGQTSRPVKTDFGWHIIKLEEKKKATPMAFQDIKQKLEENVYKRKLDQYLQSLLENNKVEFTDIYETKN